MSSFDKIRVLTMIDSLVAAGAERMAVNIANALSEVNVDSYLCATHQAGPLSEFFYDKKNLIVANKKNFFDVKAFRKLLKYIRVHKIQVIHAHSSSVYWACLLKIFKPRLTVIWHDHFGFSDFLKKRTSWGLKLCVPLIDHVFVVNRQLYDYALNVLKFKKDMVSLLLNFPDLNFEKLYIEQELPNNHLFPKYVCLANLRPQKDHHTLLDAFKILLNSHTEAQLYLVGGDYGDSYLSGVKSHIAEIDPDGHHIHLLGSRNDVAGILAQCQVGVLSSISEGLPVSLLEYGMAGLPIVCTKVGECSQVLNYGQWGFLVEKKNFVELAEMMVLAGNNSTEVKRKAKEFQSEVIQQYSKKGAVSKIISIYKANLMPRKRIKIIESEITRS